MTTGLPEPQFISRNIDQITQEMVEKFETDTDRTLYPAQVERVFIDTIAYRENLIRIGIQEAAKQNLVNYANYPALDFLGELVGCYRIIPQSALTTLRFTLNSAQSFTVTIAAGTKIDTKDGKYTFETKEALSIIAGNTTGDVIAQATEAGENANGYIAGQITELVDVVAYVESVSNITTSNGGAGIEDDDSFRARIKLAPEAFNNAGSKGAYTYWSKTAHSTIIDVAVNSPTPGSVDVYPLLRTGNPSEEILDLVDEVLQEERVRPLTDNVTVLSPESVNFTISATITLYNWVDQTSVETQVNTALTTYINALKLSLGKDIVQSQIIDVIQSIYGVYKVDLSLPVTTEIDFNEWANGTIGTLSYEVLDE
ncbi:MAG: baseplate J/gp47 family protein [Candidatus Abawacabacteria bacterium]|nr:baseplate J/gp47 family protein [Candidatus Abawacabacteria bacterium]